MRPELRIVRKEASIVSSMSRTFVPMSRSNFISKTNWVARAAWFLPSPSRQRWSWPPLFAGSFSPLEEFFCRCAGLA